MTRYKLFSPSQLTREGDEYLKLIGVKSILDDKTAKADLFSRIRQHKPCSRNDVEVLAVNTMFDALTNPTRIMHAAKVYLYKHPYDRIQEVAGLYLRDRDLEAHPEIVE